MEQWTHICDALSGSNAVSTSCGFHFFFFSRLGTPNYRSRVIPTRLSPGAERPCDSAFKRRGSRVTKPAPPLYLTFLTAFGVDDACLLRQRAQRRLWLLADPSAGSTTTRTVPPGSPLAHPPPTLVALSQGVQILSRIGMRSGNWSK